MKRGQLILALFAVLAVGAVAILAGGDGNGDGTGPNAKRPAGDALRISFVYSPEKERLLLPLINAFNREGIEVGGRPVFVQGTNLASGDAEDQIARGRLKPVAWSPASSMWGRLLNFETDRPYVASKSPSIVRTPLVIAMWEPMARALGHPRKPIGFAELLKLATSRRGWSAFGHPEFGPFKLVHTNPDYSTSGLSAVVAEYYAATGKKEGLTEADVRSSPARRTVRKIERSIVHYGDTTLFIAAEMRRHGPGYASAVAMEEVTLLDFNRTRGSQPRLVAVYPREGTFYSDNPLIVLDAPWVTSQAAAAAHRFQRFLAERITPRLAARFGFRPSSLTARPESPITRSNGVDPRQPQRVLGLPEPRVLATIKRTWSADRKPANIMLVVDTSGSMNDYRRLHHAKVGLGAFFARVGRQDRVGLTTFSEEIHPVVPLRPFPSVENRLRSTVKNLLAFGGTAFLDATTDAFDDLRELNDRERINAVVLLTDGEDTDSSRNLESVVQQLKSQGDAANQVRVFTIAYSAEAEGAVEALADISRASGGKAYQGDTDDITAVYRSISSFF